MTEQTKIPGALIVLGQISDSAATNFQAHMNGWPEQIIVVSPQAKTVVEQAGLPEWTTLIEALPAAESGDVTLTEYTWPGLFGTARPKETLKALLPGLSVRETTQTSATAAQKLVSRLGKLVGPLRLWMHLPGDEIAVLQGLHAAGLLSDLEQISICAGSEAFFENADPAPHIQKYLEDAFFQLMETDAEDPDWPVLWLRPNVLAATLAEVRSELSALTSKQAETLKENAVLRKQSKKLESDLKAKSKLATERQRKLTSTEKTVQRLNVKIDEHKTRTKTTAATLKEVSAQLDEQQALGKQQHAEIAELKSANKDLEISVDTLKNKVSILPQELAARFNVKQAALQKRVDDHKAKLAAQEAKLHETESRADSADKALAELKKTAQAAQETSDKTINDLQRTLKEQKTKADQSVAAAQKLLTEEKEKHAATQTQMQAKQKDLASRLVAEKSKLAATEKELKALDELDALRSEIEKQKKTMNRVRQAAQERLQTTEKRLKAARDSVQQECDLLTKQQQKLRAEIDTLKQANMDLEAANTEALNQQSALKRARDELRDSGDKLQKKLGVAEAALLAQRKKLEGLKEVDTLNAKLEAQRSSAEQAQTEAAQQIAELRKQAKDAQEALEKRCAFLKSQWNESKTETAAATKKLEELKQIPELKEKIEEHLLDVRQAQQATLEKAREIEAMQVTQAQEQERYTRLNADYQLARRDLTLVLENQGRLQDELEDMRARFGALYDEKSALQDLLEQLTPQLQEAAAHLRDRVISSDGEDPRVSADADDLAHGAS
ncbi:hypothetical protein J7382_01030 [Shimia sp. R11_0]|uniref:hypothetical protein n=1 Tax=Shimia sp. R11_0 TaxID=2821096 RepID=UPI001ADA7E17|nr:hypothetical protein [Shimia sp. R11_0]MBO9476104.1 hypothetical protein [Shimia sp. R11_0]